MKNVKRWIAVFLVTAMAMGVTGCNSHTYQKEEEETNLPAREEKEEATGEQGEVTGEATYTLKAGHSQAADHPFHDTLVYFADLVKEKTGGAVVVEIYPNSQLGDEATMMESMSMGTLDILMANGANTAAYIPELSFLGTCYLFHDAEHMARMVGDETFFNLYGDMVEEKGLGFHLMTIMGNGARYLYTKEPVASLEDLKGMKIRIMPSSVDEMIWTALGAAPTIVAFSEVYTALQTGMVDGAENTMSSYAASMHYEQAPYVALTEHQWLATELYISDKCEKSLPEDYVAAIYEAARETAPYSLSHQLEVDAGYREMLEAEGVTFTEVDVQAFRELVVPLHDKIAADLGCEEILGRIRELQE